MADWEVTAGRQSWEVSPESSKGSAGSSQGPPLGSAPRGAQGAHKAPGLSLHSHYPLPSPWKEMKVKKRCEQSQRVAPCGRSCVQHLSAPVTLAAALAGRRVGCHGLRRRMTLYGSWSRGWACVDGNLRWRGGTRTHWHAARQLRRVLLCLDCFDEFSCVELTCDMTHSVPSARITHTHKRTHTNTHTHTHTHTHSISGAKWPFTCPHAQQSKLENDGTISWIPSSIALRGLKWYVEAWLPFHRSTH